MAAGETHLLLGLRYRHGSAFARRACNASDRAAHFSTAGYGVYGSPSIPVLVANPSEFNTLDSPRMIDFEFFSAHFVHGLVEKSLGRTLVALLRGLGLMRDQVSAEVRPPG